MGLMFIGWLVIIGLIIWGVIAWSHRGESSYRRTGQRHDPVDIVRERYARGEITREQFEQIKKDISL